MRVVFRLATFIRAVVAPDSRIDGFRSGGYFGPSDEYKALFAQVVEQWQQLRQWAGVGTDPKWRYLEPAMREFQTYRQAWNQGDADPLRLNYHVLNASSARRTVWEATRDARFAPAGTVQTVPETQATSAVKDAGKVDQAATEAKQAASSVVAAVPLEYKLGAAVVAVVVAAIALR